ncbi:hypothetical protein JHD50_09470 [Sulfurimonas sp. MAG313]|nr:hypothetical protein [Sulfurimonas sp. MAG313]MDF1881527.1 hypothetical protein [Sulfurimonas sp. MAG313]
MKILVENLRKNGRIYKRLEEISPRDLKIRNKVKLYVALDLNRYYNAIIIVSQKSRLLMKDLVKFEEIVQKMALYRDHQFKGKILILDAPLCSKAKTAFIKAKWKIIEQ